MDIISIIITSFLTSGVVTTAINWFVQSRERDEQRRWELKREACLDALRIIDCRFADYDWKEANGQSSKIDKQEHVKTGEIRSCFNRLILACEEKEVPMSFEKCLNLDLGIGERDKLNMNEVVELRNSIRKELGFGEGLTTNVSWIKYINWRDKKNGVRS